jgi:light-regulated signal transduction histidine kinase (bacteriophytochrome)
LNSAAERMQCLINDLLEFARVTTRAKPFGTVDLDKVVADVLSDLEARIIETGAQISVGPLGTIMADRTQMRQLLQNLIGNAIKYRRRDVVPHIRIFADPVSNSAKDMCRREWGVGLPALTMQQQRIHALSVYAGLNAARTSV